MAKTKTPTARTLEYARKQGMLIDVVERYNSFTRRRNDLFGFIDLIALDGSATIGIQATSGNHVADRVHKIVHECTDAAKAWLAAGNKIQVWGWRKVKVGNAQRWQPRIVDVDEIGK